MLPGSEEVLGPSTWLVEDRFFPRRRCVLAISASGLSEEQHREEVDRIRGLLRVRHPCLTPIVAARGEDSSAPPFFVVELPDGVPLLRRVRDARERAGNDAVHRMLRRVIGGLCQALEPLHQRGLLHYDLRPERIVFDRDDEPTIVGFGLSAPQIEDVGRSSVALAYTAPEILRGDPVDHRADLYSLGVLLYEALTGRNPFLGRDAKETARAHLEVLPPPPSAVEPSVPRDLDDLVTLLLAKNPSRSFAAASDVVSALESKLPRGRRRRAPPLSPYAFTQNEFVGRRKEQRWLNARFREARAGKRHSAPITILGAGGVGKSRMLAEFRQTVRLGGGAFLLGRPGTEASRALSPLGDVVRAAAELAPDDAALSEAAVSWLRAANEPVPASPGVRQRPVRADGSPEDLGARAAAILARVAERAPLVVALDDVHRFTPASIALLDALVRALAREGAPAAAARVLVCVALREEPRMPAELKRFLAREPRGAAQGVLALKEFTRAELRAFVSSVFGASGSTVGLVDLLRRMAGGNPFLLEETIRSWIARGLVRWTDGLWLVDEDRIRASTADLRTLVRERLHDLSETSERWLRLAAMLERPLTRRWLGVLEAVVGSESEPSLRDLFRRGFLRRFVRGGEERFEIAHALLTDAVVHSTPSSARRELHRLLANALEEIPELRHRDVSEVARHRLRSGDARAAARVLLADPDVAAAARGGSTSVPPAQKIELLEALVEELPVDLLERAACLRAVGAWRAVLGDLRGAASSLEAALGVAAARGDREAESLAGEMLAAVRRREGDLRASLGLLRRALTRAIEDRDATRRGSILLQIGMLHVERGELRRGGAFLRRVLRVCGRDAGAAPGSAALRAIEVDARVAMARYDRELGNLDAAERSLRQAGELSGDSTPNSTIVAQRIEEGRLGADRGDYPAARRALRAALAVATTSGGRGQVADVEMALARVHAQRGHAGEAMTLVRSALAEIRRAGGRSAEPHLLRGHLASQLGRHRRAQLLFGAADEADRSGRGGGRRLARLHERFLDRVRAGDTRGAAPIAREGLRLARRLPGPGPIARARTDVGSLLRLRGRFRASRRFLLRALRGVRRAGSSHAETRVRAQLGLARLALAQGRSRDAERWVGRARRAFRELRRLPELADLRATAGEVDLLSGRWEAAERSFAAALRIDDRLDRPMERADDLQGLARAALGRGLVDAAWARAQLAQEALAPLPRVPLVAHGAALDARARIAEVLTAARRGLETRESTREIELLRELASLQQESAEGRLGGSVAERITGLAARSLRAARAALYLHRRGGSVLVASTDARGEHAEPGPAAPGAARASAPIDDRGAPGGWARRWTSLTEPLRRDGIAVGALVVSSPWIDRRFESIDRADLAKLSNVAALLVTSGSVGSGGARPETSSESREEPPDRALEADSRLVGTSAAIRRIRRSVARAASTEVPVVVHGETGTGKDLVARSIHVASGEARPFIVVSAADLPSDLAEVELFGHVRGAFSGAEAARGGLVEQAHGGTLVLDGVEEIPLSLQRALLRVLETGEVRRIGSSAPIAVRFRTIATMRLDPIAAVDRGLLREDLHYRLRGLEIALPPLRERREDVLPLVEHFHVQLAGGTPQPHITAAAVRRLLDHSWPGNLRELRGEVARWRIEKLSTIRRANLSLGPAAVESSSATEQFALRREDFEKRAMEEALRRSKGRFSAAARLLQMPRSTFYWKLKAYGLRRPPAGG